jgi:TBC1 domain family member 2A
MQMREDDLLHTQHIGDVIDILQTTTRHLYGPDEFLAVIFFNAIS